MSLQPGSLRPRAVDIVNELANAGELSPGTCFYTEATEDVRHLCGA